LWSQAQRVSVHSKGSSKAMRGADRRRVNPLDLSFWGKSHQYPEVIETKSGLWPGQSKTTAPIFTIASAGAGHGREGESQGSDFVQGLQWRKSDFSGV